MSKDKSSPTPTQTTSTVTQSNLPDYVEPYFKDLLDRAETEVTKDYTPYPDQRLAGFGDQTTAGFENLAATTTPGQLDEFGTATDALNMAAEGSFTDPGTAEQFMNPYITNVLDTQHARLDQRFNEDQVGRDAAAAAAGSMSNSRRGVQDAIAQRELDMQKNELDAAGYAQAYQTGADIYGTERDARMGAAKGLLEQGTATQNMAEKKAKTLAGLGGAYDDQRQAELDMGYTDFLNQRDFDRNKLNFYSGIMRGVPVSPQQESTTYNAPPSTASQLLGLGIGGLGLAKAMARKGGMVRSGVGFVRSA